MVLEGRGEALCWNGEEIRWRLQAGGEQGWLPRRSDACVLRLPLEQLDSWLVLGSLRRWRDWLWSHGAIASGTMGSCSWSLLRASLERVLFTPAAGSGPPLDFTLGGRQALGALGAGRFEGRLEHLDLEGAYARTLGGLEYGGRWLDSSQLARRDPARLAASGRPVFVRARVRIPELEYGPLPDRPRSSSHPFLRLGLGPEYPVGVTMQRLWTWPELEAAELAGCRIVRLVDVWAHFAGGRRPFASWLEAVERGRRMRGLAGTLAKMTGNALWGRFAMRSSAGVRTIRARHGRLTASRPAPLPGGALAAHDLAETVSGRVRAELYRAMLTLGAAVLCVHTDGLWRAAGGELEGWRVKVRAERLDLLGPQALRYTLPDGSSEVVLAGTPSLYAPARFEELWQEAGF
jgi:hypothetical protein